MCRVQEKYTEKPQDTIIEGKVTPSGFLLWDKK